MGLSGLFSYLLSALLPTIFSHMVADKSTLSGWAPPFYLTLGLLGAANVIYLAFATTETLDWNSIGTRDREEDEDRNKKKKPELLLCAPQSQQL